MNRLSTKKQQQIKALSNRGYSIREICKRANVSRGSVQSYIGTYRYNPYIHNRQAKLLHKRIVKARRLINSALNLLGD